MNIERTVSVHCENLNGEKQRIDSFLINHFPEYSRSYFQKLVKLGLVCANAKKVENKSFLVQEGYKVDVSFPAKIRVDVEARKVDFEIIYQNEDFMVINKPAGLIVHQTKTLPDSATLVNGLMHKFKEFENFKDKERPGIVHRLDKDTSGLLIVAKNIKSQIALSNLFKNRKVQKTYLAVVQGHPQTEGKIDFEIGRHSSERHKMSHVSYAGKPALTYYKVLKFYKDYSLVEVKIITGRTHQIRVHFAAIGHRILGDDLYGIKSKLISRQALHAWKVEFEFNGQKYKYCCPPPEDFESSLNQL